MTPFGPLEKHMQYVFSGKSALALLLRYYRNKEELKDKSDQVLVPEWLGTWVYMTMHNYCFPTTAMNKKVRGMLVYHQWGFPQKMEEIQKFARKHRLFIIEDCAHTIETTYKGRRVGTFGDASIWSLSKFFPILAGGGLYTKDKRLRQFIVREYRRHDKKLEQEAIKGLRHGGAEVPRAYALYDKLTVCPLAARAAAQRGYKNGAVEKRRRNFAVLREALWGEEEEKLLHDSEVVPWMVPLFAGASNERIAAALRRADYESGVYHFDANRNMLKPAFKECVALPCHARLSLRDVAEVVGIVRRYR